MSTEFQYRPQHTDLAKYGEHQEAIFGKKPTWWERRDAEKRDQEVEGAQNAERIRVDD